MTRRDWWSAAWLVAAVIGVLWFGSWLEARTERRHHALSARTCQDLKHVALRLDADRCHEIIRTLIERVEFLP